MYYFQTCTGHIWVKRKQQSLVELSLSAEWKALRLSAYGVEAAFLDLACESERVSPRYSSHTLGKTDSSINTRGPVRMCACV